MTNDEPPWEPPFAGTETQHLLGALDRLRWTFRWKADGLDSAGLQKRLGPSALTLGGLLKHLALVESELAGRKLDGTEPGPPWNEVDWNSSPDWEFESAAGDSPRYLYELWDTAVEHARGKTAAALAEGGLDQPIHLSGPSGEHASLRRLICDVIEEYGRHTGHADLLRENIDGRVGEDPPADWRPRATHLPASRT